MRSNLTREGGGGGGGAPAAGWTFLSNHAHVLICLDRDPAVRLRDVADRVGITERAVQRIVADLEEAGVITRTRDGRRNHYEIHYGKPLRHPIEAHATVGALVAAVVAPAAEGEGADGSDDLLSRSGKEESRDGATTTTDDRAGGRC